MSNKLEIKENQIIRTAVVRIPTTGYIIVADLEQEEEGVPHALMYRWSSGSFFQGARNYDAHSACVISDPEPGFVDISMQGYYSITTPEGMTSGDILAENKTDKRILGFRSVTAINGKAYAVGFKGLVYRLDKLNTWTRIDIDLPDSFDAQAMHGFDGSDIYAVGLKGQVWHFDGKNWRNIEVPTNINLTNVKCGGDGLVYIIGHQGILLKGKDGQWDILEQKETDYDFWGIEWFQGMLYVSTYSGVYQLEGDKLTSVNFGEDAPATCYQLSAAEGVMWSNGECDIMSYDGDKWTRIV